jgi:DNA polymerase-3 subunit epsilon
MATLFFDTETTGMWQWKKRDSDPSQPNLAQLAAILVDDNTRREMTSLATLIVPEHDWKMEPGAQNVHGISMDMMRQYGVTLDNVCHTFYDMIGSADVIVAHNLSFDKKIMKRALKLIGAFDDVDDVFDKRENRCTMLKSTPILQIPKARGVGSKWPKLEEAHRMFFNEEMSGAHDAMVDTRACMRVYFELIDRGNWSEQAA